MIIFDNIYAFYGKKAVLHGISFELEENKITAVLGKNGSGKSTLVSCLTNSVSCRGDIRCGSESILHMPPRERAKKIAVLPQMLPSVPITAEELVTMGRTPYLDIGRHITENDRREVSKAMEAVGITELKNKRVNTLSGGEKQKAYLAMTLAQGTDIIVLDEPTTYMDEENKASFISLVKKLKTEHKKTVMMVLHDLTKAIETADNILIIDSGRKAFFGSVRKCEDERAIEKNFGVKRSLYEKDGVLSPMYYL